MNLVSRGLKLAASSRRRAIYGAQESAESIQFKQLRDIIAAGCRSRWGEEHGYSPEMDYAAYSGNTPISEYEALAPFIQEMIDGKEGVLWLGKVSCFSESSGTTNDRSKYIPVCDEFLKHNHYRVGRDLWNLYLAQYPDSRALFGKSLQIVGDLRSDSFGQGNQIGQINAIGVSKVPKWAKSKFGMSLDTALMKDWDKKVVALARESMQQDIRWITGVPSWTLLVLRKVLELAGSDDIYSVWPKLEVYFHGGIAFEPYRAAYNSMLGEKMRYWELYASSEGSFAVQQDAARPGEMMLSLDTSVFYEFVPLDEYGKPGQRIFTVSQVEVGVPYAMIITAYGGLWRYSIGDVVTFTSLAPYRIRVSGRTRMNINAFGEELMVGNADYAVARANEATGAVLEEYTAAPAYLLEEENRGFHEWVFEFKQQPEDIDEYSRILDETLRQLNSDYDAKRNKDLLLQAPRLHVAPQGTFYRYMEQRDKLGGQNKVPRLANDRTHLDRILKLIN